MAWQTRDEWIDRAKGMHVVVYHNPDILVTDEATGKRSPVTHTVINLINLNACPTCGDICPSCNAPHRKEHGLNLDMSGEKKKTLQALHDHNRALHAYVEKHGRGVRLATGPKK